MMLFTRFLMLVFIWYIQIVFLYIFAFFYFNDETAGCLADYILSLILYVAALLNCSPLTEKTEGLEHMGFFPRKDENSY